jgi:ribosomal protein S18 acetylase RimI-like enzyme
MDRDMNPVCAEQESPISVRHVTPAELTEAVRLVRAAEAEFHPQAPLAPEHIESVLARALKGGGFWLFLARRGGFPLGYCVAVLLPKLDRRQGFLFVDELYVLQAHRRQGVATQLLQSAAQTARRQRCAGVRLLVRPSNAAARALYRRLQYDEHLAMLCERLVP